MAVDQKVIGDLGSDLVALLVEQVNRLTVFVEAIQAAAVTDGNTFQTNVAALTNQDTDTNIVVSKAPPTPRRFPQT